MFLRNNYFLKNNLKEKSYHSKIVFLYNNIDN